MGKDLVVRTNQAPAFSVDNNLTIADILSVAVSEAEGKLQKTLKEGMAEIKRIEARIKQIGKDIDIQIDLLQVACGLSEDVDTANQSLVALFGDDVKIIVTTDINERQIIVEYSYSCSHTRSQKKVPFSMEITRLMGLLESEKGKLGQANADMSEIRKRLANIPALERRYRGKLVANQLEKTAEGKNVLQIITANMEEELRNI